MPEMDVIFTLFKQDVFICIFLHRVMYLVVCVFVLSVHHFMGEFEVMHDKGDVVQYSLIKNSFPFHRELFNICITQTIIFVLSICIMQTHF